MRPFLSSLSQLLGGDGGARGGASGAPYGARSGGAGDDAWSLPYAARSSRESSAHLPSYGARAGARSGPTLAQPGARVPSTSHSEVARTWHRLLRFCDAQYEELSDTLNYGATDEQLAELQDTLQLELPPAVRDWFRCCNGQEMESSASCNDGLFFGLPFLSTDDVISEWRFWRAVDDDPDTGANARLRAAMGSCPAGWIRHEYSCPGWVPLITDHMGNYVGVDLMPPADGGGTPGQVILFGRDFDTKLVIWGCDGAEGWSKFLALLAEELEAGTTWTLDAPEDEDEAGEEDTIGYQGYFAAGGGGAAARGGGGDAGGDAPAGFRLTGEYKNWPVLEAWADRSMRQWEAVGLAADAARFSSEPAQTRVSAAAMMRDPEASTGHEAPAADAGPSGTRTSASMRSSLSEPGTSRTAPQRRPSSSASLPHSTRPVPAPQPLLDLPTIEDVRAVQAAEAVQEHAHTTPQGPSFSALRHGLAHLRGSSTGSSYRNVSAPRSASLDDGLELSIRPSAELDATTVTFDDAPPEQEPRAIVGQRGTRSRALSTEERLAAHTVPGDAGPADARDRARSAWDDDKTLLGLPSVPREDPRSDAALAEPGDESLPLPAS